MIWPFRPRSPLSLTHKVACERRFAKAARLLGRQRIPESAILTPQDLNAIVTDCAVEVLPERLFAFVGKRLPLPDRPVTVGWGHENDMTIDGVAQGYVCDTDEAGLVTAIDFDPALAEFPYRLAGVVAAATSEYLLWNESLSESAPPGTYEILPLFFGFGPVMANAALHELSSADMNWERWETSRVGVVSSLEFGYTMALADWSLGTAYCDIASTMRLDARETLEQGLRFLEKTDDCCFEKEVFDSVSQDLNSAAASRLRSDSSSRKLGTLHDLLEVERIPLELAEPITEQLNHREEEIQRISATALGRCDGLARPVHDELLMMSEDASVLVRRAAVSSLRPGYDNDDRVLETLSALLRKADATTATVCISTLLKYESWPDDLVDSLLKALSCMVLSLGSSELLYGVELLNRLDDNPAALLHQHFEGDPSALAIFDELLTAFQSAQTSESDL